MRRAAALVLFLLTGCSPLLFALSRLRAHAPARTLLLDRAVTGSTTARADGRAHPSCAGHGGTEATDQAWTFVPPADGAYVFRVGGAFDPVVAVFDDARELGCNDDDDASDTTDARLELRLARGHGYTVVVDGYRGDRGEYTLAAQHATPRTPGAAAATVRDPCAGIRALPPGLSALALDDGAPGAQTACGAGAGVVARIEMAHGGTLSLRAAAPTDVALEVRAACDGPSLACVRRGGNAADATLVLHVAAGSYFVVAAGEQHGAPVAIDYAVRPDAW